MAYYYWSRFRDGYIVYYDGMLQVATYPTVYALFKDYPDALPLASPFYQAA